MAEVLAGLEPQGVAGFVGVYNDLQEEKRGEDDRNGEGKEKHATLLDSLLNRQAFQDSFITICLSF